MLVSIIIPAYNTEKYIRECIESCLNQTYKEIEIIAVDDGSTDKTLEILQEYSDRIKIISKENGGTASAINAGIDKMSGQWFKKVDSDDMLYSNAIEELVNATKKVNDVKTIVCMSEEIIDDKGTKIGENNVMYDNSTSNCKAIVKLIAPEYCIFFWSFAANLVHKSIFDDVGKFDEKELEVEDYDLALRILFGGYRYHHIPKIIYKYRRHGAQKTADLGINDAYIQVRKLKKLDKNRRKKILKDVKIYRQNVMFNTGVWYYLRKNNASRILNDSKSSVDKSNTLQSIQSQDRMLCKICQKHQGIHHTCMFFLTVYHCVKKTTILYLKGWFWAYRNKTHQHVNDISKIDKKYKITGWRGNTYLGCTDEKSF